MVNCNKMSCASCVLKMDELVCDCLVDTDFYGAECPFYKTAEQSKRETMECRARLRKIGREELIRYAEYKLAHPDEREDEI